MKPIDILTSDRYEVFANMCNEMIQLHNQAGQRQIKPINGKENLYQRQDKDYPLIALFRKMSHMSFSIGDPFSILPMLKRIAKDQKKHWGRPAYSHNSRRDQEVSYVGIGHFRWDWGVVLMNEQSIKAVRAFLAQNDPEQSEMAVMYKVYQIAAELKEVGVTFPNTDDNLLHNQFTITVLNTKTNSQVAFYFYGSMSDHTAGKTTLDNDDLLNAFECFIFDAMAAESTFEDFCADLGYDEDSRKAYKIYEECKESNKKARQLITEDIYDFANELSEAING